MVWQGRNIYHCLWRWPRRLWVRINISIKLSWLILLILICLWNGNIVQLFRWGSVGGIISSNRWISWSWNSLLWMIVLSFILGFGIVLLDRWFGIKVCLLECCRISWWKGKDYRKRADLRNWGGWLIAQNKKEWVNRSKVHKNHKEYSKSILVICSKGKWRSRSRRDPEHASWSNNSWKNKQKNSKTPRFDFYS